MLNINIKYVDFLDNALKQTGLQILGRVLSSAFSDYEEIKKSNFENQCFKKIQKKCHEKYQQFASDPNLSDAWDLRMYTLALFLAYKGYINLDYLVDALGIRTSGKFFSSFREMWKEVLPDDTQAIEEDNDLYNSLQEENNKLKLKNDELNTHYIYIGEKLNTCAQENNELRDKLQLRPPITDEALAAIIDSIIILPEYNMKDIFLHQLKDLNFISLDQKKQIDSALAKVRQQHMPHEPQMILQQKIDNSVVSLGQIINKFN